MRVEGWEAILANEIEKARGVAFSWSTHSCAFWTADVVKAITGTDHAKPYRNKIKSELSAARLLKKTPLENLVPLKTKPVSFAQRGDVVMFDGALGVCIGQQSAFIGKDGLKFVQTLQCVAAWETE